MDHPVASLTLIDPVSPYGFGGTRADGTPCRPDYAGSGGGVVSPEFVQRLAAGDRSSESTASPRSVMTSSYWSPTHRSRARTSCSRRCSSRRSATTSTRATRRRPSTGPASLPARAGSSTRCRRSTATGRARGPRPEAADPVDLRQRGRGDLRRSAWDVGTLGQAGHVPGWPGEDAHPPQPMVSQTAACSSAAATSGSSASRAPATSRRSTRPSAGARCSSASSRTPSGDRRVPAAQALAQPHGQPVDRAAADLPARDARGACARSCARAERDGATVRAVGSGHSWSDVALTTGYLLRTDRLNAPLEVDACAATGTARGSCASRPGCGCASSTGCSTARARAVADGRLRRPDRGRRDVDLHARLGDRVRPDRRLRPLARRRGLRRAGDPDRARRRADRSGRVHALGAAQGRRHVRRGRRRDGLPRRDLRGHDRRRAASTG